MPIQAPLSPLERILSQTKLASHTAQKVDSNAPKNAQNLNTIKRDSKESLKDSSSKRTREKSNNDLTSFLDLQRFSQNEQEAIRLWITYKQETSKSKLKPSQIDFQLRKITRLKEQGQDICEIIERSLNHSWQGLFPVIEKVDCHALPSDKARNDRITPKMPKNIGAKTLLCVK